MRHFLFTVLSFALFLIACGDDSSSVSAGNPSTEVDSSSSIVSDDSKESSDSKSNDKASSSSVKESKPKSSSDKVESSSSVKETSKTVSSSSTKSSSSITPKSSSSETSLSSSEIKISSSGKDYSHLNPAIEYGELTDSRDGQVYKTIKLGTQTWMAENLNYNYKGSKPCYERDSVVDCSFGRYYSWAMAVDSATLRTTINMKCGYEYFCGLTESIRGVCPEGWHLPDTTEFKTLFDYVVETTGDSSSASVKTVGEWAPYVPEDEDYDPHITEATNAIGFSVRPSGCYQCQENDKIGAELKLICQFKYINELAKFWTSNDASGFYAGAGFVLSNDYDFTKAYQKTTKSNYYPVRCVKDAD